MKWVGEVALSSAVEVLRPAGSRDEAHGGCSIPNGFHSLVATGFSDLEVARAAYNLTLETFLSFCH